MCDMQQGVRQSNQPEPKATLQAAHRYIKSNDPQSANALHILNNQQDYGP